MVDKSGTTVEEDLTADGFLTISLDPNSDGVWQGQINNNTGAASYTGTYLTTINFDDGQGDTLNASGLTTEKYSATAINKKGTQTVTDSLSFAGAGDGSLGGAFAAFSSVTFTGSAKVTESSGP